jgi:hypothetical protein
MILHNDLKNLERNVKNSFHFVKNDIFMLEHEHRKLLERVADLEKRHYALLQSFVQTKHTSLHIFGNKQTRDLHREDCILAQSSSPEQIVVFSTPFQGRKSGFNDCVCLS